MSLFVRSRLIYIYNTTGKPKNRNLILNKTAEICTELLESNASNFLWNNEILQREISSHEKKPYLKPINFSIVWDSCKVKSTDQVH